MRALTIGTFDIMHEGHVNFLRACAKVAGGPVIVGVNSDRFVEKYRGKPPVVPLTSRAAVLATSMFVSAVLTNDGPGFALIKERRPDLLIIGSDWAKKDYFKQIGMSLLDLERQGTLLVYLPYTEGISSTALKEGL